MNSRRSFLKSMLLASAAPQILIAAAQDRYRWKIETQSFEFDYKHCQGTWKFVEYHKLPSGVWVKSGSGIEGTVPCSNEDVNLCNEWDLIHPKTSMPISLSSGSVDMVFHKREPSIELFTNINPNSI